MGNRGWDGGRGGVALALGRAGRQRHCRLPLSHKRHCGLPPSRPLGNYRRHLLFPADVGIRRFSNRSIATRRRGAALRCADDGGQLAVDGRRFASMHGRAGWERWRTRLSPLLATPKLDRDREAGRHHCCAVRGWRAAEERQVTPTTMPESAARRVSTAHGRVCRRTDGRARDAHTLGKGRVRIAKLAAVAGTRKQRAAAACEHALVQGRRSDKACRSHPTTAAALSNVATRSQVQRRPHCGRGRRPNPCRRGRWLR